MYQIRLLNYLEDYFQPVSNVVYMTGLQSYDEMLHQFLLQYVEKAMKNGIMIEDKLDNPTAEQIAYLSEMLGNDFQFSRSFLQSQLKQWLSPIQPAQVNALSEAMFEVLTRLQRCGKNESVLKNAYMKFMCWLYYRLRSVVPKVGQQSFYILYEGHMTGYELYMLTLLALCGGHVVVLDYGKASHQMPDFQDVNVYGHQAVETFPCEQMVKTLKKEIVESQKMQAMLGRKSVLKSCVNAWLNEVSMDSVKDTHRQSDANLLCSMYLRIDGVEDRNSYQNDLFSLLSDVKQNRPVEVIEGVLEPLKPSELAFVKRSNGNTQMDIIQTIVQNMTFLNAEMNQYAKYILVGKQMAHVVQSLAILKKYTSLILRKGCVFVLEKTCLNKWTWFVLELLVQFGVDVLVYNPSKIADTYESSRLLVQTFDETLILQSFPQERIQAVLSTTAYNAERDLDTMLYQDTGIYRNRQYKRAEPVVLRTMYEEIEQLWNETVSMRTGFETTDEHVVIPVLYAKVLGVKDGNVKLYQKSIERLVAGNDNVYFMQGHVVFENHDAGQSVHGNMGGFGSVISSMGFSGQGFMQGGSEYSAESRMNIAEILTNRKVDLQKVRQHPKFSYGYLQDDTLQFMVDRLDALLWSGIIDGIGQHGNENKLMKMFFGLPKDVIRLMQKFDFTKVNPKLVYLNTSEQVMSLEDTMFVQYLSMLGFDVVLFIPTGYNVIDGYFRKKQYTDYQLGEYLYNLRLNIKRKKGFFG